MIKNFRAFSLYMGTLSLPLGMLPLSVYASTSHQSLSTTAVSNFFFNGGTVVNQGTAGSYSQSVEINSGSISNINGAFFAPYCQGAIKFLGPSAYFENDATSQIGPGPVTMQSGLLVNHGTMSLDLISNNGTWVRNQAVSYISGGSLSGSGQMWIAGDATFNTDVSQSKIVLGQGFDLSTLSTPVVAPAKLILNNVLFSSPLTITNQGLLTGSGTVSDLTSQSGVIYPGYNASSLGAIDVLTDVAFSGTLSSLQVSLLGTSANLLKTNQNLSFDPGSKVVLASILSPPKGSTTYTIANFTTFSGALPELVNQTGFTNAFSLSLLPNSLVLNAAFPSVLVCPDGASVNVCQMIDTLNAINGKCPPATQAVIDKLLFMTPSELEVAVLQLISVFKKAQFLLEKLDLLIHKELEPFLYEAKEGISLFALAGYDSLKQGSSPSYLYGYRGKSFYQFLGTTWKHNHFAWLLGLGVSETNFIVGPQIGKAHFTTLYGNLGASANFSRWKFGLDAMFSEGMLSGYRKIAFLGLQAKNKHNLWNASIDGKLSYTIKSSYIDTCLYEQIGYDIGKENPYLEYQATGVNQDVKHEKISVLRNALGLMLTTPEKKPWLAFVDGSWVYDHYIKSKTFLAAFEATDVYGSYINLYPPSSLGRAHAGLKYQMTHLDLKLAYTGLFGKKFQENSVSFSFNFKF